MSHYQNTLKYTGFTVLLPKDSRKIRKHHPGLPGTPKGQPGDLKSFGHMVLSQMLSHWMMVTLLFLSLKFPFKIKLHFKLEKSELNDLINWFEFYFPLGLISLHRIKYLFVPKYGNNNIHQYSLSLPTILLTFSFSSIQGSLLMCCDVGHTWKDFVAVAQEDSELFSHGYLWLWRVQWKVELLSGKSDSGCSASKSTWDQGG